jgi:hypothetical protein
MEQFPPLFPKSKYLAQKTWHKIIYYLSFIYSACCLYSHFLAFGLVLQNLGFIQLSNQKILTLPMILPLLPLMWLSPSPHINSGFNFNFSNDPNWGLIILMIYFLISVFIPSLIYKILLNGFLGKRWRK